MLHAILPVIEIQFLIVLNAHMLICLLRNVTLLCVKLFIIIIIIIII
jgi:hypothetical protein